MTLTDAFCRLNRARGLELVSPDDLLNACAELNRSGSASLTLHTFDGTGVMALRYVSSKPRFCLSLALEVADFDIT